MDISNIVITSLFFLSFILINLSTPLLFVDFHLLSRKLHSWQELRKDVKVWINNKVNKAYLTSCNVCGLAIAKHRDI